MAPSLANDLLAVMGQNFDGRLVSHRAGSNEQGRLALKDLRGPVLQAVDGRIFAVDVVAHRGVVHGLAHRLRRLRDRVASQID